MDLSPIVARLRAQLTGFIAVGSAADLDAVGNGVVPAPSCYLVPVGEVAQPNGIVGGFTQRVEVTFLVVIVSRNLTDTTGAAALAGLETLRQAVKGALVGWAPDAGNGDQVEFVSGDLVRFEQQLMWWADNFKFSTWEKH